MAASGCKYNCYRVRGLPLSAFGETYLVITAFVDKVQPNRWEYFLVSKRLTPILQHDACIYENTSELHEALKVDEKFLIEEATQQAEAFLSNKVEQLFDESGSPNFLDYRFEILPMNTMPLHSLWFRGDCQPEIKQISSLTKCATLKVYLDILVKSTFTRRPG